MIKGITTMENVSFKVKVLMLVLASCCLLGAPTGAISLKESWDSYTRNVETYRKAIFAGFDASAKSEVDTAVSMLQAVSDRQQTGEITMEEAKRQGADLLRKLRFGKDCYLWADTPDGTNVVFLGKPAEGKNRFNTQDANGKYFIQEIIKNGMAGGGFTNYQFARPESPKPFPKRSYSLYFKPFNWVIGTGNYVDDLEALVKVADDSGREHILHGIYLLFAATGVILVIICFAALYTVRQLLRHIGTEPVDLEKIAGRIAAGDLTVFMVPGKTGIYEAMRCMVDGLRRVIEQVNKSSVAVSGAAAELHACAKQIADGSEEVVGQASTVATAGEEMSATSNDIAQNCHHAADSARHASEAAKAGVIVVDKTIEAMNQIARKVQETAKAVENLGARSEQIGEITRTIEDIADQTNLLALNAAIEAARAGDQGRGFAVVADEVRRLAERTTNATKEIGTMVKAIQEETTAAVTAMNQGVRQVEDGTSEAAESGTALREILEQITAVDMQISQVATAAEEQTATTQEISGNMIQITQVVQQTSREAGDSAKAAAQLSDNAEELQHLVRQFKL